MLATRPDRLRIGNREARMLAGPLQRFAGTRARPARYRADRAARSGAGTRRAGAGGDPQGPWKAVQSFNRFGRAGRETLPRLIEFQELWLRDLLRALGPLRGTPATAGVRSVRADLE
jgi:hypothetical protein